jgi:hypothetical protein
MMRRLAYAFLLATLAVPAAAQRDHNVFLLRFKDGRQVEADFSFDAMRIRLSDGKNRDLKFSNVLSVQFGAIPTPAEEAAAKSAIDALSADAPLNEREKRMEELAELGLAAFTPVLKAFKDTDIREPSPLYRAYGRLLAVGADALDRSQDVVRLANGEVLRGSVTEPGILKVRIAGKRETVQLNALRTLAVRRAEVVRDYELHSLRHSWPIGFCDVGIVVSPQSKVEQIAEGVVRLDFNFERWMANPDGLIRPDATGQKHVINGFKFGALLGRVGAAGEKWLAGRHAQKVSLPVGRLYFGINDNDHWQNNIGRYRCRLSVTEAYDVGDPDA